MEKMSDFKRNLLDKMLSDDGTEFIMFAIANRSAYLELASSTPQLAEAGYSILEKYLGGLDNTLDRLDLL